MKQPLITYLRYLRAGECPHNLGDSSWCADCQNDLADQIEHILALTMSLRIVRDEIDRLQLYRLGRPL